MRPLNPEALLVLKPWVNCLALLGIINRCRVTCTYTHTGPEASAEMCDKPMKSFVTIHKGWKKD